MHLHAIKILTLKYIYAAAMKKVKCFKWVVSAPEIIARHAAASYSCNAGHNSPYSSLMLCSFRN